MTGCARKCVNKSNGAEMTGCGILAKCSPSSSVSVCAPGKLLFQSNFDSLQGSGSLWLSDPMNRLAYLSLEARSCIRSPDSCCAANRGIWVVRFPLCLCCSFPFFFHSSPGSAFQLIMLEVENQCCLCQEGYVLDPVCMCVCLPVAWYLKNDSTHCSENQAVGQRRIEQIFATIGPFINRFLFSLMTQELSPRTCIPFPCIPWFKIEIFCHFKFFHYPTRKNESL